MADSPADADTLKREFKKILREILSYGGGSKDLAEIDGSSGVLKSIDKANRVINCLREVEPETDIVSPPSPEKVDVPKEFKCTLSKKIMIEPVIIASGQVRSSFFFFKSNFTNFFYIFPHLTCIHLQMHALILTLPRNYMIVYICVLCASSVMCARITYGELCIQVCSVVLYKYKRLKDTASGVCVNFALLFFHFRLMRKDISKSG